MRSLVALKTLAPPLPQPTSSPPRSFWRGSFLAGAAGSGGRPTRSYKKVLKAHVRGRILSWSNWTLLTRFLLQSDSPDDGSGWHPAHRLGRRGKAADGRRNLPAAWLVCSSSAWRYSPRSATRTRRPLLQSINDCGFTNRGMDTNAPRSRCPFCGLPMQFRFIEYSTLQTFECNGCQAVLNIPPQADVLEIATPVPARG